MALFSIRLYTTDEERLVHRNVYVTLLEARSPDVHTFDVPDPDYFTRLGGDFSHATLQVYPADAARHTFYQAPPPLFVFCDERHCGTICARDDYLYFKPTAGARRVTVVCGVGTVAEALGKIKNDHV